jgi:type VI secretion system protein VasD
MHPPTAFTTRRHSPRAMPAGAARRRACTALALLLCAGWSTGCGMVSKITSKPATLSIQIGTSESINPDARKRPSPVVVRIYELKSTAQFDGADFVSLYEKDQALLGADLVIRDEFVLRPGEVKLISKALAADAKYIGVIAAFRELERARWRASVALVPGKNNAVSVQLDGIAVQAAVKVS